MYGVKDTATTVVPAVAGAATAIPTVAGASVLPSTGENTLLTVIVGAIVVIGAIATLVQIGAIAYRRRVLSS